jgi:hypothetical protein
VHGIMNGQVMQQMNDVKIQSIQLI